MTSEEALQMLIEGGFTGPITDKFMSGDAVNPQGMPEGTLNNYKYSAPSAPSNDTLVTEPWILDALKMGNTRLSEEPMDGPVQEQENLQVLRNLEHEGASRVNANTTNTGIRAIVDEKGNVTLTNLTTGNDKVVKGATGYDSDGNPLGSIGSAYGGKVASTPNQIAVGGNVHGLVSMLRKAQTPEEARGIQSQLQEAMASEQARMYTLAQEHAQTKLGIPDLENDLAYMQSRERQTPGWVEGMPESAQTMEVRKRIDSARGMADTEAKRFLAGNVTYAALEAAAKNASSEVDRISKAADARQRREEAEIARDENRKDQQSFAKTQADSARIARKEDREELIREKAEAEAAGVPQAKKDMLRLIYPDKANASDVELLAVVKQNKDKSVIEILEAEDSQLPVLAVNGNTKAFDIVAKKEASLGIDPAITKANIVELRKILSDPMLLQKGITEKMKGESKETKAAALSALSVKQVGTAEDKKALTQARYDMAMSMLQNKVGQAHRNNADRWMIADPLYQAAVVKAKEATGKTDMPSVLTAYIGNASGAERRALVSQFKKLAQEGALKTQGSMLNAVDPVILGNEIETLGIRTMSQRIMDLFPDTNMEFGANVTGGRMASMSNMINQGFYRYLDSKE